MDPQLIPVSTWLKEHMNTAIRIRKHEQDDLDEVRLTLTEAGYRSDEPQRPDEYTDGRAIILHGQGSVITGQGMESPLPQDMYVIPVSGLSGAEVQQDHVELTTERASYSLMLD